MKFWDGMVEMLLLKNINDLKWGFVIYFIVIVRLLEKYCLYGLLIFYCKYCFCFVMNIIVKLLIGMIFTFEYLCFFLNDLGWFVIYLLKIMYLNLL